LAANLDLSTDSQDDKDHARSLDDVQVTDMQRKHENGEGKCHKSSFLAYFIFSSFFPVWNDTSSQLKFARDSGGSECSSRQVTVFIYYLFIHKFGRKLKN